MNQESKSCRGGRVSRWEGGGGAGFKKKERKERTSEVTVRPEIIENVWQIYFVIRSISTETFILPVVKNCYSMPHMVTGTDKGRRT
jgi:hypothetical protein